jgi:hypothetical protein
MVGLVSFTEVLVALTDQLSGGLLGRFGADVHRFIPTISSFGAVGGSTGGALVVFVVGLVAVLAGIVLIAELVVRAALIFVVPALAPLVFAATRCPALRGRGARPWSCWWAPR